MNIMTSKVKELHRADQIHVVGIKGTNKVSLTVVEATGAIKIKKEITVSNALRINISGACYKVFSSDNIVVKGDVEVLQADKNVTVCGEIRDAESLRGNVKSVASLKERDIMDVVEKPLTGKGRAVVLHIFGNCSLFVSDLNIPCSVIVQGTTVFCKSGRNIGVYGSAGLCTVGDRLITSSNIKN